MNYTTKQKMYIITLFILVLLSGCETSFDSCMTTCMDINEGYGRDRIWFIELKDFNDMNETIREYCYEECK